MCSARVRCQRIVMQSQVITKCPASRRIDMTHVVCTPLYAVMLGILVSTVAPGCQTEAFAATLSGPPSAATPSETTERGGGFAFGFLEFEGRPGDARGFGPLPEIEAPTVGGS